MSAPSGIKWGSIVNGSNSGRKGKIGIYVSTTSVTNTNVKFHVEVWFWTIYSCSDSENTVKFNAGDSVTSASTVVASNKSISHTIDTGSGWDTRNQTKLYEYDSTTGYDRHHSDRVIKFYASFSGIGMLNGTMYANTSYTIEKKPSYTVTFNANGGSNAPSSQTKWYGETLTLSSTKPTRTGHTFKGWSTSSSATSATYSAGGSYTANASDTLYAVWQANTYTVTYNANGGSGAPSNQTKTYGVTLVLSSTKPTRTNYTFKGWSTSSAATSATYSAGGNYTANAAATLYAVWELAYVKPRIKKLRINRCLANGTPDDQGTYALVSFYFETDKTPASVMISYKLPSETNYTALLEASFDSTSGTVNKVVGSGNLSADVSYDFMVTVTDSLGSSDLTRTLLSASFTIDFLHGGAGVAFGKAAEIQDTAEFNFDIVSNKTFYAKNDIYDKYGTIVRNGVAVYRDSSGNVFDANTTNEHCIVTNTNAPTASNHYIITYFYSDKSGTKNRTQIALPYRTSGAMYHRFYNNGTWTSWKKNVYGDELAAYVVEKGTSNGWTYRKWSNGVAECWYNKTINGFACNTPLTSTAGSWYRTGEITASDYPLTFSSTPNLQMTFETFSGTGGLVWSCGTSSSTPKTKPANIYIIRISSAASISGVVHYYAIGNY